MCQLILRASGMFNATDNLDKKRQLFGSELIRLLGGTGAMPGLADVAIRASYDDNISVRVSQPELAMIGV